MLFNNLMVKNGCFFGGKTEVITALKAGVNNYIVKPFTPQVLKEKLAAVLGIA